jgi:hypothetical protein
MPTGSVLQVVHTLRTTDTNISSGTLWTNEGSSVSFTPKFANSTLLIAYKAQAYVDSIVAGGGADWNAINFRMVRTTGSDVVLAGSDSTSNYGMGLHTNDQSTRMMTPIAKDYTDSPNTTSAVTYQPQVQSRNGHLIAINSYNGGGTITIMEIAQ